MCRGWIVAWIARRLRVTPMIFLLLATVCFFFIVSLIELSLSTLNQFTTVYLPTLRLDLDERDIETCQRMKNMRAELADLTSAKESYITEIAQMEEQRRDLQRTIALYQQRVKNYLVDFDELEAKNQRVRFEVVANMLRINELHAKATVDLTRIEAITFGKLVAANLSADNALWSHRKPDVEDEDDEPFAFEDRFDYKQCRHLSGASLRMGVFLFSPLKVTSVQVKIK